MPPAVKEGNEADTLEISGMLIPAAEEKEGGRKKRKVFGWDREGDNGAMTRGRSISGARVMKSQRKKKIILSIYVRFFRSLKKAKCNEVVVSVTLPCLLFVIFVS